MRKLYPLVPSSNYQASNHLEGFLDPETRKQRMKRVVERLRYQLRYGEHFDAIAYRGASGAITASIAAHVLDKPLILVRKEEDVHGHSCYSVEGPTNIKAYVIVDDFMCSGKTYEAIRAALKNEIPDAVCIGMIEATYDYKSRTAELKKSITHYEDLGLMAKF